MDGAFVGAQGVPGLAATVPGLVTPGSAAAGTDGPRDAWAGAVRHRAGQRTRIEGDARGRAGPSPERAIDRAYGLISRKPLLRCAAGPEAGSSSAVPLRM